MKDESVTSSGKRLPAGERIKAALPDAATEGGEFRTAARWIVDGEHPDVTGAARRKLIDKWRRYIQRWVKKPVGYIIPANAEILERYLPLSAEDLTSPVLTETEKQIREAQRLERKARQLRRQIGP